MLRVGIAGLLHESNTFLGVPTTYENFAANTLTVGPALLDRWTGALHELGGFLRAARDCGFTPVPLLATIAIPSGTITPEAFERLSDELLGAIRDALPLDGLLIALHGATASERYPDADGELLKRIRRLVGPELPIVNTLDLHANVSRDMIQCSNATVIYRSNPHLDQEARGFEAGELMSRILKGAIRPVQALETPPMVIRISRQYTSEEPARSLYTDLEKVQRWPGILSASVAMGFYYADVPEMGASFVAVADGDPELARKAAKWMAKRAWERRRQFAGLLPSVEVAVREAAEAASGPVVIMDVGDNVGGGSPGDSTTVFAEILKQGVPNALVILYDPKAVETCLAAGPGATVSVRGITGHVRTVSDGHFVETQVRHGGWGTYDQGLTAVVETAEQHTVVLTSRRMAPMSLEQILSLGIHPERKKILIVKGVVAPRAAYAPVASRIILADSPGVTADNPAHFTYQRRRVPLFPLEESAEYA